jgi:hypothetical protein
MIKLSKNIEWIRSCLEDVTDIVDFSKITEIKGIPKTRPDRLERHLGLCIPRGKKLEIQVWLSYQSKHKSLGKLKCSLKYEPLSKIDILEIVAHELAHTNTDWLHTTKHRVMTNFISTIFMDRLNDEGYITEEHELKDKK